MDPDVRQQVIAVPSDDAAKAGAKFERAIAESVAKAHERIAGVAGTLADVTAVDVAYDNPSYPTVDAALDHLLYVPLVVSSFVNNVGTVEVGAEVTSVTLSWAYNKDVVSQGISGYAPSLNPAVRSFTVTTPITASTTFTLTASDGRTNVAVTSSVLFRQKRYWGVSPVPSLVDADILALTGSEFAIGRGTSKTLTAAGQYLYFAYPAAWGEATFTVNGLLNTAWEKTTRTFVNASGHASTYHIYRSQYLLTGTYQITIS